MAESINRNLEWLDEHLVGEGMALGIATAGEASAPGTSPAGRFVHPMADG